MLSQAIQADFFKTTPIPECTPECTFEQSNQLAEFIIADDAEMVGRLVIDRIINITWAMAERELGLTISENPDTPSIKKENTH